MDDVEKKVDNVKEYINLTKGYLESKINEISKFEEKLARNDKEITKVRELVHTSRDRLANDINDAKQRCEKIDVRISDEVNKIELKVENNQFWLKKYQAQLGQLDGTIGVLRQSLTSHVDKLESEIERRIKFEDMKRQLR